MEWLRGRRPPDPPPSVTPDEYTIDTVRDHLEAIGMFRPNVRSAAMKVALTLIAWNGETYLNRQSTSGTPSGAQIVTMCKQLETVRRVVADYGQIEATPSAYPNPDKLLAQGITAVLDFALRLAEAPTAPGGSAQLTGYAVDTQILSGPI